MRPWIIRNRAGKGARMMKRCVVGFLVVAFALDVLAHSAWAENAPAALDATTRNEVAESFARALAEEYAHASHLGA
jgi:hypothetical protein